MQKNITIKILFIFLIVSILLCIISPLSVNASGIISDGDDFLSKANDDENGFDEETLKTTSKTVYNILLTIGIIIAVIVGIVLGIQWMIASVEDKAKIKEMLVPYIVGCIVIFGAFTIWSTLVDFGQSSSEQTTTHESSSEQTTTHQSSSGGVHGGRGGNF